MILTHNISALNTLNKLTHNNKRTVNSIGKLSSGLRINKAGDDAAGLAISEKMRGQIRGLNMAGKNIQDGISFIQTAESGLGNIGDPNLIRLRELAIQSANDTLTDDDRKLIQNEVEQIKNGINDIANNTEFNGIKLLNKEPITITSTETVVLEAAGINWEYVNSGTHDQLNSIVWNGSTFVTVGQGGAILSSTDGESWIRQTSGTTSNLKSIEWNGSLFVVADSKDILTSTDGVNWTKQPVGVDGTITSLAWNGSMFVGGIGNSPSGNDVIISSDGVNWSILNRSFNAFEDIVWAKGMFVAVHEGGNISTSQDGLNWTSQSSPVSDRLHGITSDGNQFVAVGDSGKIVTSSDGVNWSIKSSTVINALKSVNWNGSHFVAVGSNDILISEDGNTWSQAFYGANWSEDIAWGDDKFVTVGYNGHILISSASTTTNISTKISSPSLSLQIGANSGDSLSIELTNVTTEALGIDDIDFSTRQSAELAISKIDEAISKVSSERGKFGAYQNRLEHTHNNVMNTSENLQSAESRIRDTDIAKEMMNFTKNNILTQASQAMLAQANQKSEGVLQLLK